MSDLWPLLSPAISAVSELFTTCYVTIIMTKVTHTGSSGTEGEEEHARLISSVSTLHLVEVELLLLELLLVLLQELLVLLLDHQLLQGQGLGVSLRRAPLGQGGRLGPPQGPVLPLQLGHGCRRRHGQPAYTLDTNGEDFSYRRR